MRNHSERVVPHWRQRSRASRSRAPSIVTARCSTTSCLPLHLGHGTDSACASTTAALATSNGRSGVPPGSSSNKRWRAFFSFCCARAASRCVVRGRGFLAMPSIRTIAGIRLRLFAVTTRARLAGRAVALHLARSAIGGTGGLQLEEARARRGGRKRQDRTPVAAP